MSGKCAKPVVAAGQNTNLNTRLSYFYDPFPNLSLLLIEMTMSDLRTNVRMRNVHIMGEMSANYIPEGFQSLFSFSTEKQIVVSGTVLLCDMLGI